MRADTLFQSVRSCRADVPPSDVRNAVRVWWAKDRIEDGEKELKKAKLNPFAWEAPGDREGRLAGATSSSRLAAW